MARTASGRVDGWHLRSIQCSTVITGSVAAAGLLSDRNIESNCGRSKAFERSTFLLSHLSAFDHYIADAAVCRAAPVLLCRLPPSKIQADGQRRMTAVESPH